MSTGPSVHPNLAIYDYRDHLAPTTDNTPPAYVKYLKREPVVAPKLESAMALIADRRERKKMNKRGTNHGINPCASPHQTCEGPQSSSGANDQRQQIDRYHRCLSTGGGAIEQ